MLSQNTFSSLAKGCEKERNTIITRNTCTQQPLAQGNDLRIQIFAFSPLFKKQQEATLSQVFQWLWQHYKKKFNAGNYYAFPENFNFFRGSRPCMRSQMPISITPFLLFQIHRRFYFFRYSIPDTKQKLVRNNQPPQLVKLRIGRKNITHRNFSRKSQFNVRIIIIITLFQV